MIYETHAHYDDKAFESDRDSLLKLLKKENINPVINISSSMESIIRTLELCEKYDHVYAAVGIHPSDCENLREEDIKWIEEKCKNPKVVAIGEIGLDYHYDEPSKDIQKKWFIAQLKLALKIGLPISVHSRDAANDTFNILNDPEFDSLKGVIHCFSYSAEMAKKYVNKGYFIGVGGVVTFKNGRKLHETVKEIPIEKIVIETDSPYLAPVPYRGHRNSSVYLTYIIEQIARIKQLSYDEVERITYENGFKLYGVRADG
ncbi:MAG: TatD family hydrolase [Lachnospiraceae bacterium]|nr:TatD family hydrolase [Lachnospiraceae bacterium]